MTRDDAVRLIESKVPNENLRKHMIAVGAIMETMAKRFDEDPDRWFLTGMLHDIDLGETDDPDVHGIMGAEWLADMGFDDETVNAVKAHADHAPRNSNMAKVLYAADQLSGLITACALVKGKKLSNVTPKTVRKRFKEKRFAAGANRDNIRSCEDFGMELDEFITVSLEAMTSVSDRLGL